MLDNNQLATELIITFAGVPPYARKLAQEAARRLVQMAPDYEFTVPQEAKSLRKLVVEWPMEEDPQLLSMDPDWNDNYLRMLCAAAADRIEQMAETIASARKIQAERDALKVDNLNLTAMVEQLENSYGQLQEINDRTFRSNQAMGEDLKVIKAELEQVKQERVELLTSIRDHCGCDACKHEALEADDYPCAQCRGAGGTDCNWEWRGAKDTNVPGKIATDTNVGNKEN